MKKILFRRRAISALVAATACCALTAQAQLEEVVVTAQKREQSLQDVPMAVSAISGAALNDAGVQTVEDLARLVPSLEVQSTTSTTSANFRIRRVGNLGNIPDFEPAVGVFLDGAFRARSIFGMGELFDVDRVEVLRGPQSTLYGKNVTAGVIAIYTASPAEEFEWKGEVTGGNMEGASDAALYNFKGGISGPLTDSIGGSLGVSYAYHDKTQEQALVGGADDANELERYSVRGQLRWDATDKLSLRAILGTVQQDENDSYSNDYFYDPDGWVANDVLPSFQAYGVSDTCTDNDSTNRTACNSTPTTSDLDANEATLLVNYGMDNGWSIDSITSYDDYKFKGTQDDAAQVMAPLLKYHDTQEGEAWQQELRLTSTGGETVDWMGGVFYYHSEFKRGDEGGRATFIYDTLSDHPVVGAVNQAILGAPIPIPFATQGQIGYLDGKQETDYYAIYGQATWTVTDKFSINAGARWQKEEKDAHVKQWVNDPSPSIISIILSPADVSADNLDRDAEEVTWSVTPQYFLTDDTMLYLTVAHGFKSGGFNTGFGGVAIADREFDDEDIMHYEGGVKTELLDGNVRLAGSVFYTEYDDYQDAAFVGGQFTVGNAEKAELKGVELEGTALLTENLTADFAVSYASFEYDENTSGQCYPGRASDSTTNPGACDLSGENPINAPEWKSHIGLTYEQPVSWGDAYARVDWSWTDEYNTSFSADPRLKQDSYSWVNARIGTRWNSLEFVLWGDNLTDEDVVSVDAVANIYAGDGSYQSFLMPPRSYGVTLRANY
jgi:iron complex outermembrane recepter protein